MIQNLFSLSADKEIRILHEILCLKNHFQLMTTKLQRYKGSQKEFVVHHVIVAYPKNNGFSQKS